MFHACNNIFFTLAGMKPEARPEAGTIYDSIRFKSSALTLGRNCQPNTFKLGHTERYFQRRGRRDAEGAEEIRTPLRPLRRPLRRCVEAPSTRTPKVSSIRQQRTRERADAGDEVGAVGVLFDL